jgi:nitrogen fixation protein NifU and related proteins
MMADELKGKPSPTPPILQSIPKHGDDRKMDEEAMGKLCAFAGVRHFPMRVKCAILPWHAMLAGLGQTSVSTDTK